MPALDPCRDTAREPFYGIKPISRYPYHGSALVVWDVGPLRGDLGTPPAARRQRAARAGVDPHGLTGRESAAQDQFAQFIDGVFVDVCGASPCHAAGWTGP